MADDLQLSQKARNRPKFLKFGGTVWPPAEGGSDGQSFRKLKGGFPDYHSRPHSSAKHLKPAQFLLCFPNECVQKKHMSHKYFIKTPWCLQLSRGKNRHTHMQTKVCVMHTASDFNSVHPLQTHLGSCLLSLFGCRLMNARSIVEGGRVAWQAGEGSPTRSSRLPHRSTLRGAALLPAPVCAYAVPLLSSAGLPPSEMAKFSSTVNVAGHLDSGSLDLEDPQGGSSDSTEDCRMLLCWYVSNNPQL